MVLLMRLLLLMMLMMLVVLCVVVMVAFDPDALALSSSPFLLVVARAAQPSPVLLVPSTQWLAAKGEVVIFDNSGNHPWMAVEIELADGGVCDMEVRDEEIGLGSPIVR